MTSVLDLVQCSGSCSFSFVNQSMDYGQNGLHEKPKKTEPEILLDLFACDLNITLPE